ncbi:MAG TPA: hypothetical protein VKS01_02095, partial [Bryobacteraceae bacterium]|nr:hypothetical protein [Bryobacteraceae bacterium]
MRTLILFLGCGLLAAAQSHPAWWMFADPDSTSLMGVKWSAVRDSPFGAEVSKEFAPGGTAPLPALACLMNSRDFMIAAPPVVVGADAGCTVAEVRAQAPALGMRR